MPSKVSTDVDYLVSLAVQVKYNAKRMKKLEKEYQAIKARETEEQIELRRLRTENRILRQRVENLEQVSDPLMLGVNTLMTGRRKGNSWRVHCDA